jgi:hypothetical protein
MCNVMLLVALATPIFMTNTPNTQNEHYRHMQWRFSCILVMLLRSLLLFTVTLCSPAEFNTVKCSDLLV